MQRYHNTFIFLLCLVIAWSWLGQGNKTIWCLEGAPVLIILVIISLIRHKLFPPTTLFYFVVGLSCVILLIGARYTYVRVPLFNYLQDIFNLSRNHYDRVGHFFQGFTIALVLRELLLRTSDLRPGKWLTAIIVLFNLGIASGYEIIECAVGLMNKANMQIFLGFQGDWWDTQKDIFVSFVGSIVALAFFARSQDKQISKMKIKS